MTKQTSLVVASAAFWLTPALARAHGGHHDAGALHGLWHALPLLGAGLLVLWAVRAWRSRSD